MRAWLDSLLAMLDGVAAQTSTPVNARWASRGWLVTVADDLSPMSGPPVGMFRQLGDARAAAEGRNLLIDVAAHGRALLHSHPGCDHRCPDLVGYAWMLRAAGGYDLNAWTPYTADRCAGTIRTETAG